MGDVVDNEGRAPTTDLQSELAAELNMRSDAVLVANATGNEDILLAEINKLIACARKTANALSHGGGGEAVGYITDAAAKVLRAGFAGQDAVLHLDVTVFANKPPCKYAPLYLAPPPQPREGMVVVPRELLADVEEQLIDLYNEKVSNHGIYREREKLHDADVLQRVRLLLAAAPDEPVSDPDELPPASQPPSEGELPELPRPWQCETRMCPNLYTAEQMRAYGEQCRRLAASGQVGEEQA